MSNKGKVGDLPDFDLLGSHLSIYMSKEPIRNENLLK